MTRNHAMSGAAGSTKWCSQ